MTNKRNKSSSDEHFKEEEHSAVLRQKFARVADLSLELNYETSSYQQLFHQTLTSSSSEVCDQCFPKSGDIRYQTNYSSPPRFVRKNRTVNFVAKWLFWNVFDGVATQWFKRWRTRRHTRRRKFDSSDNYTDNFLKAKKRTADVTWSFQVLDLIRKNQLN